MKRCKTFPHGWNNNRDEKFYFPHNCSFTRGDNIRSLGGPRIITLDFRSNHTSDKYQILIKNIKALGLWIFSLIKCSIFTFPSSVGLIITLDIPIISPSSAMPFMGILPLKWKLFHPYLFASSLDGFSETRYLDTLVRKTFDTRSPSRTRL